jgi:hypothetical protein
MTAKFVLLGLQGAVANGAEPTFDAQRMEPGVHLRWGFARELGFPPGGFWLYRRVGPPGETVVTPPRELGPPARLEWGPPGRTLGLHAASRSRR